jgi:hypothetical protein
MLLHDSTLKPKRPRPQGLVFIRGNRRSAVLVGLLDYIACNGMNRPEVGAYLL